MGEAIAFETNKKQNLVLKKEEKKEQKKKWKNKLGEINTQRANDLHASDKSVVVISHNFVLHQ